MIKFDAFSMVGLTEQDNKILMMLLSPNQNLCVDECGRVYTNNNKHIANIKEVGDGRGIMCIW